LSQRFVTVSELINVGENGIPQDCLGGHMEISRARVMGLLEARVPLSLLHDLMSPHGPASAEIFAVEAGRLDPLRLPAREHVLT